MLRTCVAFSVRYITDTARQVKMLHVKCRGDVYLKDRDCIPKFVVPDDRVLWSSEWPDYNPPEYTSFGVAGKPWADPDIGDDSFEPKWNMLDGKVNRVSHARQYSIADGYPLNVVGRTGLRGRGCLGRWGPNHAADPIVTRWKRDNSKNVMNHPASSLPVLQFVAIQRRDSGEWALPGGMVDPGEDVSQTLKREFLEEAMNVLEATSEDSDAATTSVEKFFEKGDEIYRGYVDDPRNTDNAWMETVAVNFHDKLGTGVGSFPLQAGDDAVGVQWIDVDSSLPLYASHANFLKITAEKHKAHW